MAYTLTTTFVRPNTGVAFPKFSDYNAEHDTWRREYFTNNSIGITFAQSEDELTLVTEIEFGTEAVWNAFKAARDTEGNEPRSQVQAACAERAVTMEVIAVNEAGVSSTLLATTDFS
tara:strand:+ start:1754 stop:2104 length:351 start_codon:yes stop_codon:yes gene_type:complete